VSTYYIDFVGGSDANNGTAKGTAWKHHPYMTGWTGVGYSHSSGDRFIFKGGVTWDNTCYPWAVTGSGSSGAGRDYYGVDATWYTGGAWTRPVFDYEYTASNTSLMLISGSYLDFDNLEFKRFLATATAVGNGRGLVEGGGSGTDNTTFFNCYVHGWKAQGLADDAFGGMIFRNFSQPTTLVLDNTEVENSENIGIQRSGVCVRDIAVIRNGSRIHDNSSGVLYCIDFDSSYLYNITGDSFGNNSYHTNGVYLDPQTMGVSQGYFRNSYLHDVAGGANLAYPNVRAGATVTMYNCILYGTMSSQLAVEIDPYQYTGEGYGNFTAYNNTIYNYSSAETAFHVVTRNINVTNVAADGYHAGVVYIINSIGTTNFTLLGAASNTIGLVYTSNGTTPLGTGTVTVPLGTLTLFNNHVINAVSLTDEVTSGGGVSANTISYSNGTNLLQSAATATSQGYVLGNLYAPTGTGVGTYNTGTNESGTFTTDILGISRPQGGAWDIGAYEFIVGAISNGYKRLGRYLRLYGLAN
jgi:hypothetical protein